MDAAAHRTVSLHEWHLVGAAGLPVGHRTVHVVRALRDGLGAYTYRFDRREASVRAVSGVRVGEQYVDAQGLQAVDLVFSRPLAKDETASFEYETSFRWQSVPPPQVRRAARQPVERVDMRVQFSAERLPAEVVWGLWDGYGPDARLRAAEPVELDADHAAHRFIEELEGHTVGFTWTWRPGEEPTVAGAGFRAEPTPAD